MQAAQGRGGVGGEIALAFKVGIGLGEARRRLGHGSRDAGLFRIQIFARDRQAMYVGSRDGFGLAQVRQSSGGLGLRRRRDGGLTGGLADQGFGGAQAGTGFFYRRLGGQPAQ